MFIVELHMCKCNYVGYWRASGERDASLVGHRFAEGKTDFLWLVLLIVIVFPI